MFRLLIIGFIAFGLLTLASPALAGKTCKDGVTPKSSGCPLEFTEQLVAFDSFDSGVDGWSKGATSYPVCGGNDPMLVLAPNPGVPVFKDYNTLPEHNFVRIQATVYFVDDWESESAGLAIDGNLIWTETHNLENSLAAQDMCGSVSYPESKVGVPIDIIVPHTNSFLNLSAFTALGVGVEAALAIDDIRVSVFTYAP